MPRISLYNYLIDDNYLNNIAEWCCELICYLNSTFNDNDVVNDNYLNNQQMMMIMIMIIKKRDDANKFI